MGRRISRQNMLWAVLTAGPLLLLLTLAWKHAVPVPSGDDFAALHALKPLLLGQGNVMEGIWEQHMESRFVAVRLAYLGLGTITGWRFSLIGLAVPLCAALNALLLLCVLRPALERMVDLDRRAFRVLTMFVSLSPAAWESWNSAYYLTTHLVFTFTVLAILALRRQTLRDRAIGAVCCAFASLSFVHGFAAWILLLPLLPRRARVCAVWLAAAALLALAYFWGYRVPSAPGALLSPAILPRAAVYGASLLGLPASLVDVRMGALLGLLIGTGFAGAIHALSKRALLKPYAPILCAYAFALVSAAAILAGRLTLPLGDTLASRYVIMVAPAGLCLLAICGAIGHRWTLWTGAALLVVAHLLALGPALTRWDEATLRKRAGLECLRASAVPSDDCMRLLVWWDGGWVLNALPTLRSLGKLPPR